METQNRYIIVANSGRGRCRAYKILDLSEMKLLPEVYERKPVDECLALNRSIQICSGRNLDAEKPRSRQREVDWAICPVCQGVGGDCSVCEDGFLYIPSSR